MNEIYVTVSKDRVSVFLRFNLGKSVSVRKVEWKLVVYSLLISDPSTTQLPLGILVGVFLSSSGYLVSGR